MVMGAWTWLSTHNMFRASHGPWHISTIRVSARLFIPQVPPHHQYLACLLR